MWTYNIDFIYACLKFTFEISTITDIGLPTSHQAHVGQWKHGHVRARPIGGREAGNYPRPRQSATQATTRPFAQALYYTPVALNIKFKVGR
jgi:hypothetical protein